MAITLVVEDGSGLATANSYVSVADADTYFEGHYYSTDWDNLTDPNKYIVLAMAARLLDEWVMWNGDRATEDQGLRWPRYGVYDRDGYAIDSNIVPTWLANAAAEQAMYISREDLTLKADTKGFSEMKVDTLMLKIDKADRDSESVIPDAVKVMVEPYGVIRTRQKSGSVSLSRA